jgi:NTP pyrophosphatase (non-canonical NTP hydrolase)
MTTLYIAGKIGNLPMNEVEKNFNEAREYYSNLGYEVVSPLDLPHNHDRRWHSYMMEDLQALMKCDEVAMLPNWVSSPGAKIEYMFANRMGKIIHFKDSRTVPEVDLTPHYPTLLEIIDKFGSDAQIEMMIEECSEVIQALQKLKRAKNKKDAIDLLKRRDNVNEEIADLTIMMQQAHFIFDKEKISAWIDIKMDRVKDRIANHINPAA